MRVDEFGPVTPRTFPPAPGAGGAPLAADGVGPSRTGTATGTATGLPWDRRGRQEALMRSSEDTDRMYDRLYEAVKARAAGDFAPGTGVRVDATKRRIYVVKNDDEVSLGLTAQQALDLLEFLREHEQLLARLAAEARAIHEQGIPDGDITPDRGPSPAGGR